MLNIKTSANIKASISYNVGYEHLNEDIQKRWVSAESLEHKLTKLRTLTTEEIIVEIEELIKQLKEGK